MSQKPNTPFVIPEKLEDAKILLRQLRTDMQEIQDQLTEANEAENVDKEWQKAAKYAFRKKNEHKAALADHVNKLQQQAKAIREAQANFSITAHLKYHSKLMGRLNNLLVATEALLEDRSEENFETMSELVKLIREMDAVET